MVPAALALITLSFLFLALNLKNKWFRDFFFLFFLLMVVVDLVIFAYGREVRICTEVSGSYSCEIRYEFPGRDTLIYAFGMILLLFLMIITINYVFKTLQPKV